MQQDTGTLIAWLKGEGEPVTQGEPIMEIETDKATVEIEAPASGILRGVCAREGEEIPVGQVVAWILAPGEPVPDDGKGGQTRRFPASPVARRLAEEHGVDLTLVRATGRRIGKDDVLKYLETESGDGQPRLPSPHPRLADSPESVAWQ
jgi:pyruvate/2-oxoglutarate dehydrogenase complex dihydrolipoamide acyltransferase (E2) component